jgi:hypothetical protein
VQLQEMNGNTVNSPEMISAVASVTVWVTELHRGGVGFSRLPSTVFRGGLSGVGVWVLSD